MRSRELANAELKALYELDNDPKPYPLRDGLASDLVLLAVCLAESGDVVVVTVPATGEIRVPAKDPGQVLFFTVPKDAAERLLSEPG